MKTYVVIPNFTISDELRVLALDAIRSFKETADCVVVVADDNSPEDTEEIKKACDVFLKRNEQGGFSKCVNTGFRYVLEQGDADYVVCANNDITVPKGWLKEFDRVVRDFGADMVGGLGYREKGAENERAGAAYVSEGGRLDDWLFPGGFWLMKNDVLDDIGILDENFEHGGMEDIDFFHRAKRAGKKLYMTPKVWYWHQEGATRYSERERGVQKEAFARNVEYFKRKHGIDGLARLNDILVDNRINL